MNIVFDNIIFSLQKAGGISVVWYELLKRVLNDQDINSKFLNEESSNIFYNKLDIPDERVTKYPFGFLPTPIQRYLNPNISEGGGIFHSSYYRIADNQNYINVTTVHDFTYEYYRSGLSKFIHSRQKARAIKKANCIICVSENTKYDLLKFYPETEDKMIRVIHNGVDESYHIITDEKKVDINKIIPFSRGEYALFVGDRKSNHKNFSLAVESCIKTGTPLVMVGGGNINSDEREMLANLGKSNYIQIDGISNQKLNLLYNYALCLIYPSSYEGFGIPVIEAQKAGCPVVASDKSSIGEVIGPVVTLDGLTVGSIAEMIKQYKVNSNFVNKQVELGLKNSKRFSWDKCYQETKKVYSELYQKHFE